MARTFNGSTNRINVASAASISLAVQALTFGGWVKLSSLTHTHTVLSKGDAGSFRANYGLYIYDQGFLGGSNFKYIRLFVADGSNGWTHDGTAALSSGVWAHVMGVYDGSNLKAYLNGAAVGQTAKTGNLPTNTDDLTLGYFKSGGSGQDWLQGDLAEIAVWNAVLTAGEIASLAKGFAPYLIRPQSLNFYMPVQGNNSPELDVKNALSGTVTGATKSDHPSVFYHQQLVGIRYKATAASNVTVTPNPATAAAASVAPTTVLGSITLTPTSASAAAAKVDPTVVLGSVTIAPSAANAAAVSVDPSVDAGGDVTVTPTALTAAAEAVAPSVVLGSVTIAPSAASTAAASVAPTVVQGSVSVAPSAASAAATKADPAVVLGSLTLAPSAISAVAASVDPDVVLSAINITPSAAETAAITIAPEIVLGSVSVSPASVAAVLASVVGEVVQSSIAVQPTTVSVVLATTIGGVVQGSLSLTPSAVGAVAAVVVDGIVLGSVVIAPNASSAKVATVDPTVNTQGLAASPRRTAAVALGTRTSIPVEREVMIVAQQDRTSEP